MSTLKKPIALVILDGWGIGRADDPSNAIQKTATPNMDELAATFPATHLACSGEAVGLPDGQMGNSEVGHLNIGAGRVVYQELTRITKAIRDKDFFKNPTLCKIIEQAKQSGGALHLMGLLSDGGVHSHITHLYALVELAKEYGLKEVYIHTYLDGRDVPPSSGLGFIDALEAKLAEIGLGKIATVSGRYYAMDRDKRWERVEKAYAALVYREGQKAASAHAAVQESYDRNETDEFVLPTVIESAGNANIKANDGVIFFNFRPDRGREITRTLVDPEFSGFNRKEFFPLYFATMTQYDETLPVQVAYPPQAIHNTLGEIFCERGLKQLRIAETEKYAHVTFFFNGGEEKPCGGEDRILIPSPKVATYDLQPEMSAVEVTDRLVGEIAESKYDLIILNFANGDMVGHTGFMDAAMKAVATVDACVGRVVKAMQAAGGIVCITADHGNAEMMVDPETGEPFTAHTTNVVPFILVSDEYKNVKLREGILADISPTILRLAGIEQPGEMTGTSLIK